MSVRAKFQVQSITHDASGGSAIDAFAVHGGEHNKAWAKFTPSGTLRMFISKDTPAGAFFRPGQFLYLDISEAPEKEPAP